MVKPQYKNLIQVSALKNKFSSTFLEELKNYLMSKTSQEKVAVIDSINKNNTLQDEDKLFLVHQVFSLPYYVRVNISSKL